MKTVEQIKEAIENTQLKIESMEQWKAKVITKIAKGIADHPENNEYVSDVIDLMCSWQKDAEYCTAKQKEYITELRILEWVLNENKK